MDFSCSETSLRNNHKRLKQLRLTKYFEDFSRLGRQRNLAKHPKSRKVNILRRKLAQTLKSARRVKWGLGMF